MWAWGNGAPMLSDDGLTAQLDAPGVVEALQLGSKFMDAYGGFTAYQDFKSTFDVFGAENPFVTDQIGGTLWEQWYLNVLAQNSARCRHHGASVRDTRRHADHVGRRQLLRRCPPTRRIPMRRVRSSPR